MPKKQPKHDKSRDRGNYTFHPGRIFHLEWTDEPGDCYLFALDDRETSILRKMLQVFPKYHWVWGLPSPRKEWDAATWQLWDDISEFVDELEACLVSGCDLNEWIKQQRILTAAIVGEALDLTDPEQVTPDQVDFTAGSATPGLVPSLRYLEHLQILGTVPGAGDTIQQTLWDIRDAMSNDGMTLDDMIGEMTIKLQQDPDNYNFKDWLEMLTFIKELWPNAGSSLLTWVLEQYRYLMQTRHAHTHSTLMAYQATELRAIRNALAPFDPQEEGDDEESIVKSIISDLDNIPWLTTAIAALIEPSPSGETALAVKIGLAAKNLWDKLTTLYQDWMDTYINQVESLQPRLTVAGMIAELSKRIRGDNEDYGTSGQPATLFGALDRLNKIADHLENLDLDMPEGVTWQTLFADLETTLGGLSLSVTNNVDCSSCGGSVGGCSNCGGNPVVHPDPVEGSDSPDASDDPAPGGGGVPPGFDGTGPEYSEYKCKAANYLFEDAYNALVYLGGLSTIAAGVVAGQAFGTWLLGQLAFAGFGAVASGGVVLFATVAAWEIAAIVAVIAVVVALAGGAVMAVFADIAAEFQTSQEDVVCGLYNAQNVDEARQVLSQALADAATNFVVSAPYTAWEAQIRSMASDVVSYFTPTGNLNKLFERDETVDLYSGGPVDCTVCGCENRTGNYGILIADDGQTLTLDTENLDGAHRVGVRFYVNGVPCGSTVTITNISIVSGSITPNSLSIDTYRMWSDDVTNDPDLYSGDNPPTLPMSGVRRISITSGDQCRVQISYIEDV